MTQCDESAPDQERPLPRDAAAFFKGTGARGAGRDRGIELIERLLARAAKLEEENAKLTAREGPREELLSRQSQELINNRRLRRQGSDDEEVALAVMGQLTLLLELEFSVQIVLDSFSERYVAVLATGISGRGLVFTVDFPNRQLLAEAPALGLNPKPFDLDEHGLTPNAELLLYGWINAGGLMAHHANPSVRPHQGGAHGRGRTSGFPRHGRVLLRPARQVSRLRPQCRSQIWALAAPASRSAP